jgi:MoxR-like ATPase
VDHADELEELTIVQRMSVAAPQASPVLSLADLIALQAEADSVFVHHVVAMYAVQLVMATRRPERFGLDHVRGVLECGVSARGSLGLITASRALAILRGRDYVLPGDIADVAADVLAHRLVLSFDAVADGVDPRSVVDTVLVTVPRPRVTPEEQDTEQAA